MPFARERQSRQGRRTAAAAATAVLSAQASRWGSEDYMSYSLNSLKGGLYEDCIGDYYRVY